MLPTIMGRWFSLGPPVSSTNKTERHDITEILLKVALNNIKPSNQPNLQSLDFLTMLKHIFRMIIQFCKLLPVQIFTCMQSLGISFCEQQCIIILGSLSLFCIIYFSASVKKYYYVFSTALFKLHSSYQYLK